jgi:hypothetical protein
MSSSQKLTEPKELDNQEKKTNQEIDLKTDKNTVLDSKPKEKEVVSEVKPKTNSLPNDLILFIAIGSFFGIIALFVAVGYFFFTSLSNNNSADYQN